MPGLDLDKLKRGEIVAVRGPLGNFSRGVYAEGCFFVRRPLETVGEALLRWDTSKHPELEVSVLREYTWLTLANVFDSLSLSSRQAKDAWLIDRTWQMFTSGTAGELFVTASEASAARIAGQTSPEQRDTKASEFWRKILASRDKAMASGGLNALPRYSAGKIDISIRSEFDSLMKSAPQIAQHFQPLLRTKSFAENGTAPSESAPYWQKTVARGHSSLNAGVAFALKRSTSWQAADCTYFTSDTYFMSVTLYELFPVGDGTLVWQSNFVSAPFRGYLGGADRFFAGKEIVKEMRKAIPLFRNDVER